MNEQRHDQGVSHPTRDLANSSTPQFYESVYDILPGVHLPLRSLFLPLSGILISPVGTREEDAILPSVQTLVEPSLLHHIHLAEARALAPTAQVWGPPGFAEKTKLDNIREFGRDFWPHDSELAALVIEGAPKRNEVVFLHRRTRTLYTADLVFNVRGDAGPLAALTFRMMGVHRRFGVARPWKHWVKDRRAFDRSIAHLFEWNFDRIVPAHGSIVETGGKQALIDALRERDLLP